MRVDSLNTRELDQLETTSGTGAREVSYSEQNTGAERQAAITIGGQVHTIRQQARK